MPGHQPPHQHVGRQAVPQTRNPGGTAPAHWKRGRERPAAPTWGAGAALAFVPAWRLSHDHPDYRPPRAGEDGPGEGPTAGAAADLRETESAPGYQVPSVSDLGLPAGFSATCTPGLILAARAHYLVASTRAELGRR